MYGGCMNQPLFSTPSQARPDSFPALQVALAPVLPIDSCSFPLRKQMPFEIGFCQSNGYGTGL